jgi:hypothetical protein
MAIDPARNMYKPEYLLYLVIPTIDVAKIQGRPNLRD